MWTTPVESIGSGKSQRYCILRDGSPLVYAEALRLWSGDAAFRSFFIEVLADAPQSAYRWEMPPVTAATINRQFEFVLLDAPRLERPPEPHAFAEHFSQPGDDEEVVAFANLGRNAILVVPTPRVPADAYGHLAAFMRRGPDAQRHALWKAIAQAMQGRLSEQPVWLSTAGMGVAWLHVRLDDRPKYYGHQPYTRFA